MENQKHKISPIPEEEERYELIWPGKAAGFRKAYAPLNAKLLPCMEESVNFDGTENLYLEGDNLDAMKLLLETHGGKVKLIYIDPPYNTGKAQGWRSGDHRLQRPGRFPEPSQCR